MRSSSRPGRARADARRVPGGAAARRAGARDGRRCGAPLAEHTRPD
jgi:hypothetical protein